MSRPFRDATAATLAAPPGKPPHLDLHPAERRLVARLRTPVAVQRYLNSLPYNDERDGKTARSFRGVVAHGAAHCLEAALFAATVLEQHGYPPLLVSLESVDLLDHVLFVHRGRDERWGSVARSRDPGLHGRRPVFRGLRELALSYVEPYVDDSGCLKGYGVLDLRTLAGPDWRTSERNLWRVEEALRRVPHRRIRVPARRVRRLRRWYRDYRARYARKPVEYAGRERWSELPPEWR